MSQAGVYVFSDAETTAYVGESTSVSWRIDQHVKSNSRLMKSLRTAGIADPIVHAASAFDVRAVPVDIGRLELEEMAIACLHPTFNAMHLVSRMARLFSDADIELWLSVEEDCESLLREGAEVAANVDPVAWSEMRPPSGAGLYILRDERGEMLYVGETDALAERLSTHSGARSYFSALRRHVGTELLGLAFAPEMVRGFSPINEACISDFLRSCTVAVVPVAFGRWELERHFVQSRRPLLNREHAVGAPAGLTQRQARQGFKAFKHPR